MKSKKYLFIFLLIILVLLFFIYWKYEPAKYVFFPTCPVRNYLGFKCAGCGFQQAIHLLLHGSLEEAFYANPLFVIAIPVLFVALSVFLLEKKYSKLTSIKKMIFNKIVLSFTLLLLILYSIFRNI